MTSGSVAMAVPGALDRQDCAAARSPTLPAHACAHLRALDRAPAGPELPPGRRGRGRAGRLPGDLAV